MALPKQVQQHLAEVEAFEKQLSAPAEPAIPEIGEQTEPPAPQIEATAPEPTAESPRDEPTRDDSADEAKWEHKYRRLQGKYDAEVPRLYGELKELRAQMEQLLRASQKPEPETPAEPQTPAKPKPLITDQDVEAFGEDLIDLQRRVAREVVSAELQAELATLREQNKQMREQVTAVQGSSFETRLRVAVPDFDQVNQDERWYKWLNEFDPMLRAPRRVAAQAAYERGDAEAVKSYVELFKQTIAPAPEKVTRQAELQRQVQPTRTAGSAPTQPGPKTYSMAQAQAAWDKVQKLIMQHKYDEAATLENEISAAYAEGRVGG